MANYLLWFRHCDTAARSYHVVALLRCHWMSVAVRLCPNAHSLMI